MAYFSIVFLRPESLTFMSSTSWLCGYRERAKTLLLFVALLVLDHFGNDLRFIISQIILEVQSFILELSQAMTITKLSESGAKQS